MSKIYLDQWVWINLLKAKKGRVEYLKYDDICSKIIETSKSKKHIYPFSMCHLIETQKRTKLESRKELFQFIFEISRFHTIFPWTKIIDFEVRNAILKSIGKNHTNLSHIIFGKGIGHCFGSKEELKPKNPGQPIPKEIHKKMFSAMTNPELMSDMLTKAGTEDYVNHIIKEDKRIANKVEYARKKEYSHPDKQKRKDISNARFFINIIQDKFIKQAMYLRLDVKKLITKTFSNKKNAENFLKLVPTAYVFHVLNDSRNLNKSRSIKPNDIYDLGALAIAVPYCDVVVTEREWTNILNQKNIGKLYNTTITYDLERLHQII